MHTYTYIYTHAHIYMYTCLYIYIHTDMYTHTYDMYICTHASTPGTTAWQRLREKPDLEPGSSTLLSVRCDPEGSHLQWPAAQLLVLEEQQISVEQPQPTAAHHIITTARHPGYTRCTSAGPIHPIHGRSGRMPRRSCPEIGFAFLPFSLRFSSCRV